MGDKTLHQQVGKPCAYCGITMEKHGANAPTYDHIIPVHALGLSRRKKPAPWNRAYACNTCNNNKGGKTLGRWLLALVKRGDPRAATVSAFIDVWQLTHGIRPGKAPSMACDTSPSPAP